jgi:putative membrane protein
MKIRHFLLGVLMSSAMFFASCEKDEETGNETTVNNSDKEFTFTAGMGNYAEVNLGQLAATKATNAAVKAYGQMMVADHTPVGVELDSIAASLNLTAPDSLDAEHVALRQTLSGLSGRAFDSTYIASQVKDHQRMISVFEQEVSAGANTKLKNFASSHLPHLRLHLQKADSIRTNVIR